MARYGAKFVLADMVEAGMSTVAEQIKVAGGSAFIHKTNTSVSGDVEALIKFAVAKTGGLHLIANNAGIGALRSRSAHILLMDGNRSSMST